MSGMWPKQAIRVDQASGYLRDVIVNLLSIGVQRNMNVLQAMIDTALKKIFVCKTLSIGDHAVEQTTLCRILKAGKSKERESAHRL